MEVALIEWSVSDIFWLTVLSFTVIFTALWSFIVYYLFANDLIDSHFLFTIKSIVIIYIVSTILIIFSSIMFFHSAKNSLENILYL